jgi:hypothetical protein
VEEGGRKKTKGWQGREESLKRGGRRVEEGGKRKQRAARRVEEGGERGRRGRGRREREGEGEGNLAGCLFPKMGFDLTEEEKRERGSKREKERGIPEGRGGGKGGTRRKNKRGAR